MWSQEQENKNHKKVKRDSEDTVKLSGSSEAEEDKRQGKAVMKEEEKHHRG